MKGVEFIWRFGVFSREGKGKPASKSEVSRWIAAGAVWVNGEKLWPDERIRFDVFSLVLFPNGKRVSLK